MRCQTPTPGFATCTAALAMLSLLAGPVRAAPGDNSLVSANPVTHRATGQSFWVASISDSGRYVAFDSNAATLVAGDTNGWSDVFVLDRLTGITERISVGVGGIEPNGGSLKPTISGDGRYVAFNSWASNLVANDTNGKTDVFVYDRTNAVTRRASMRTDGSDLVSDASVGVGGLSDDGRYVAFESYGGIYLRDMVARTTTLIGPLNVPAPSPVISGNGRYVLYTHPSGPRLYVYDRLTGSTQLLSEGGGNDRWFRAAVSGDGRWVAYASISSEVVDDTNGNVDVYLLDRATGVKRLASVSASGKQTTAFSLNPSLSDDGRYVAFRSYGSELVTGARADTVNLLVKDMQTGFVEWVASTNIDQDATLSSDGGLLAFLTTDAMVVKDPNASADTYVHEVGRSSILPVLNNYYLRPSRIDFGEVRVSTSQTRSFALANAGNTALPLTVVELIGPNRSQFALKSFCGSSLPVGGKCSIAVTFRPTAVGNKQAQLHVVAGGIERSRPVTGTAVRR